MPRRAKIALNRSTIPGVVWSAVISRSRRSSMKRLYGIRRLQAPRDNLASDVGFFLHVMMSRLLRILGVQHAQTENHAHHYLQSIAISEQSVQFHGIPSERHGGTIDFYENRMDSHEAILTSLQE